MPKIFEPDEYVKSVFEIDFEKLYENGFRGLMFDIDNTLVPQDEDATEPVKALFEKLSALAFRTVILSNNSEERVSRFAREIPVLYRSRARKPLKRGYNCALALLKMEREQVAFIGDRVMTDIFGAKRAGIYCILVEYIRKNGEKPNLLRKIENRLYKRP